jgi:integrase
MPRKPGTPSLRRHKPSGQGVVTLSGKDVYLGVWPADREQPPPEVSTRYHRELAEWEARGRLPALPTVSTARPQAVGISVAELILAFMRYAEGYYRKPDGKPTASVNEFVLSLRPLNHLYGGEPAKDVGPLKLKPVRELMVKGYLHPDYGPPPGLCRRVVNSRIQRLTQCFKWAVGEELLGVEVYQSLKAVGGLKKNRSEARESEPIRPAPVQDVEAVLPLLTVRLAGAARFQLHTGARPGEALALRLADVERSGAVWLYRPRQHKTAHHDKTRVVAIGPKAKAVLREFIKIRCPICGTEGRPPRVGSSDACLCGPCSDRMDDEGVCGPWQRIEVEQLDAYLFSPVEAVKERDEDRRARRKTKVQPSQVSRKKPRPNRKPGEVYDTRAYARAISRCCEVARVPHWHPNQLRHTHATAVRKRYGLEAAQVTLGHSNAAITQVYAERDLTLAVRVASEIG